ncbi:Na(+)/H(+) antiporter subunit F1 [Neobacillus cucumis]|uniref:Na(+)/H(+) antiporter subunit F n=1 Tax=Neobacillus cucumis TaxID=1740721 RepID=A0A2N5H8F4_9BACI|nr:Na(+)/H(+) antiporter subunit F1 [Neobacillus cucumis]PLS01802.1 Na(+)/H(+) antiporter subunit F [Neobacillus cucumis]
MIIFYSVCLVLVILSMLGLLYRVWKGPSVPDRLVALDAVGVMLISAIALFSILFDTPFFIDAILLIAIMSFIGTVSFSKFIERGEIIERGSDR